MTDELEKEVTVLHLKDRATVMSGYELSAGELKKVIAMVPLLKDQKVVNIVDKNILSGLIIKIGSRLIDATLNGALHSLRKQLYESN